MKSRNLVMAVALFGVTMSWALPATSQTAQSQSSEWMVPRTADGHPDLQGVWANNSATPLERPEVLGDRAYLTDEEVATLQARAGELFNGETDAAFGGSVFEAALEGANDYQSGDGVTAETPKGTGNYNQFWLVDRDFDNRTSLIINPTNGRLPDLTPGAVKRAELRRSQRGAADSYSERSNSDRCITYGVPRTSAGYNSYFQIFQTPTHIAVLQEMIHEVRLIPMEGPHLTQDVRQYNGDSRARWEGDTLVIETRNYSSKNGIRQATEHVTTTERFTRVSPDTLQWEVTYEDPNTWAEPWTLMIPLSKSEDAIFEYACHEGNYAMEGILAGQRALDTASGTDSSESR